MRRTLRKLGAFVAAALTALSLAALPGCSGLLKQPPAPAATAPAASFDLSQVPAYTGSPCTEINDNVPSLTEADAEGIIESYSPLDDLGRCGAAAAVVSEETMPADGQGRGGISDVRPSGWEQAEYPIVPGGSLYNRCHLLGWQLTAEDANERNLVTGTRYMNVEGMLPFEDEVADYVHRTGGRVLYRVTPVFEGDELVCRGVRMEALSLGDGGAGLSFDVFCYNVQPGVEIDYATGESRELKALPAAGESTASQGEERTYVLNTSTKRFHLPGCPSAGKMKPENKEEVTATRDDLLGQGYEPCGSCNH